MTVTSSMADRQRAEHESPTTKHRRGLLFRRSAGPGRTQPLVNRGLREDESATKPYMGDFSSAQSTARGSFAQTNLCGQRGHGAIRTIGRRSRWLGWICHCWFQILLSLAHRPQDPHLLHLSDLAGVQMRRRTFCVVCE